MPTTLLLVPPPGFSDLPLVPISPRDPSQSKDESPEMMDCMLSHFFTSNIATLLISVRFIAMQRAARCDRQKEVSCNTIESKLFEVSIWFFNQRVSFKVIIENIHVSMYLEQVGHGWNDSQRFSNTMKAYTNGSIPRQYFFDMNYFQLLMDLGSFR